MSKSQREIEDELFAASRAYAQAFDDERTCLDRHLAGRLRDAEARLRRAAAACVAPAVEPDPDEYVDDVIERLADLGFECEDGETNRARTVAFDDVETALESAWVAGWKAVSQ